MSDTPKRFDPLTLRSIFDANGGDTLLENCDRNADEAVFFSSENLRHPGTVKQQKIRWTRNGFKLVEIQYTHEDGSVLGSFKYLFLDGIEHRAAHSPHGAYMLKE